jgi:hypothetical protein
MNKGKTGWGGHYIDKQATNTDNVGNMSSISIHQEARNSLVIGANMHENMKDKGIMKHSDPYYKQTL